jgi:polyisoprenoid-binding protein YceI
MLPDDKKEMLNGHLKDTAFFFIAENPEITVTVKDYKDNKLNVVINILGLDIKQAIPVKVTATEKDVKIKGDFGVDVSALKMVGMMPDPASGEKINSVIDFQLDVTLKK